VAEEELIKVFSQGAELQGNVESVRVVRDKKTNIGKVGGRGDSWVQGEPLTWV